MKRSLAILSACAAVIGAPVSSVAQAPGTLNLQFNPGTGFAGSTGTNFAVYSLATQADGKILAGGLFSRFSGSGVTNYVRINPDGSIDPTFFTGIGASATIRKMAIQPDGKILLGGDFQTVNAITYPGIARLHSTGFPDESFRPGSGADGSVRTIAIQTDQTIYIGGSFSNYAGVARRGVARLFSSGTLDATFAPGAGVGGTVENMLLLSGGDLLLGGTISNFNNTAVNALVRVTPTGARATNFTTDFNTNASVRALALQTNGLILVGGSFLGDTNQLASALVRLNGDGTRDTNFVGLTNVAGPVQAIRLCKDGTILVAGGIVSRTNGANGTNLVRIVHLLTNGVVDTNFGVDTNFAVLAGPDDLVFSMALDSADRIFVGGTFRNYDTNNRAGIASLTACTTNAQSGGGGGQLTTLQGTVRNAVNGQTIPGVLIQVGSSSGITAAGGTYSIPNVLVTNVTMSAQLSGFTSATNLVNLLTQAVNTVNFNLSPGISDTNTIRLVLTWGQNPGDLDSHLRTPIPGVFTDHVFFGNRGNLITSPFASLDLDNVSGFGPETITITNLVPGIYNYYIHRFSGIGTIASSPTRVDVFGSGGLLATITAPTNIVQDYWRVLQIDGTTRGFAIINQGSVPEPTTNIFPVVYTPLGGGSGGGNSGAPNVLTQPQDALGFNGGTVTLSAFASGTLPLTYQWLRNGVPVTGANQSVLVLNNLQVSLAGSYTARISNPSGTVNSQPATVSVLSTTQPFVIGQPINTSVPQGGSVTFTVLAGGGSPLGYQWRRNGSSIPGANSPTLVLTNVQPGSVGKYSVIVSNPFGVAVSTEVDLTVLTAPIILSQPQGATVDAGATVLFSVTQSGATPLFYQWARDGVPIPGATVQTLRLTDTQFTNSGNYTVSISNVLGVTTSQPALLTVRSRPLISVNPADAQVTAGNVVQFSVQAIGTQPFFYQWRHNGTNIPGATSVNLQLTGVQTINGGPYTVAVTNSLGSVTSSIANLHVILANSTIPWSQNAGGTGSDVGKAIAVDATGNVLLAGEFAGTATFGTNTLTSAGLSDVFLAKLDANGNYLWATRAGGSGSDSVNDLAVDSSGNSHFTGSYEGSANFGGIALTNSSPTSFSDLFVAKYDANGNPVWAIREGVQFVSDIGKGISVDGSQNVYIAGNSGIEPFGGAASTNYGRVLLAKYNSNGVRVWARKAGSVAGGSFDSGNAVAVSSNGFTVYLAGSFQSTQLTIASLLPNQGGSDMFIARYDLAGNLDWAQRFGGPGNEAIHALTVDASDNLFAAGEISGTVTVGLTTLQSTGGFLPDAFVARFTSSGTPIWATAFGGTGSDSARDIVVDSSGRLLVTGFFSGAGQFGTNLISSVANTSDLFAAQLDREGGIQFVQQVGGNDLNGDFGFGVAVDAAGNGFFTGGFHGTATAGSGTRQSAGGSDVLLGRLTLGAVAGPASGPAMEFTVSGNQIIFSWLNALPGLQLQGRGDLGTAGVWTNLPQPAILVGDRFFLTNTVSTNFQFFRLQRP